MGEIGTTRRRREISTFAVLFSRPHITLISTHSIETTALILIIYISKDVVWSSVYAVVYILGCSPFKRILGARNRKPIINNGYINKNILYIIYYIKININKNWITQKWCEIERGAIEICWKCFILDNLFCCIANISVKSFSVYLLAKKKTRRIKQQKSILIRPTHTHNQAL